jgi:hypothetical protein
VVAAGFNVKGAGAGALCIVCHNTRVTAPVYSDSSPTSWSAPHTPSQGDIFAGRTAYFYGLAKAGPPAADSLPNRSPHLGPLGLVDSCVTCHVDRVGDDIQAQYSVARTNHTFTATRQVCNQCHASGSTIADGIAEGVDGKLESLEGKLIALFQAKLNLGVADMVGNEIKDGSIGDGTVPGNHDPADGKITIAAGSVQSVSLSEFHGSPALIVTLTDGTTFGAGMTSFKTAGAVQIFASGTNNALTANQVIAAKAAFNYFLIEGGAAHGLHNPDYVNGVLDATITAVDGVSGL